MQPFVIDPWSDVEQRYNELVPLHGIDFLTPMLWLTQSIVDQGAAKKLVAFTSMHELVITAAPISSEPDWLRVSVGPLGTVRIAHRKSWAATEGDVVIRPVDEILPLFWRFVIEKWGARPARDLA